MYWQKQMRILIDECVDWRLLRDLPNHDVKTVRQMGWTETINGALLRLADRPSMFFNDGQESLVPAKRRALQDRRCRFESKVGTSAAPS